MELEDRDFDSFAEALAAHTIPPKPVVKMNTYVIHYPEQTRETTAPTLEDAMDIALFENIAVYDTVKLKEE
jgi:hypothetical protein